MYEESKVWIDNWLSRKKINVSEIEKQYLPLKILDSIMSIVYINRFELQHNHITTLLKMGGNYPKDPNDSPQRTLVRYKLGLDYLVQQNLMIRDEKTFTLTYSGTIKHLSGGFVQEIYDKMYDQKIQRRFWKMPIYAFVASLIAILISLVSLIISK